MSLPPLRVLVVDDHPFFRDGILAWVRQQEAMVSCGYAESPAEALVAIAREKPDLVLLDLHLRDGDGLEVLRAHASSNPPVFIVVSQKDEIIFAERALNAGARGYVLKSEASEVLLNVIHTVINGGTHVSPAVRRHWLQQSEGVEVGPADKLRHLYQREFQVLQLLGCGHSTKAIAERLGLSPKTVEAYRENLKKKLGVPDSLSLVRLATIWELEGRLSR